MTLRMLDSIYPANLPVGADAYLGYVDGEWATAAQLRLRFPGKHILTLTVKGGTAVADGCDREAGDLSAGAAVAWAQRRLAAGAYRPVIYASASNMAAVLSGLETAKTPRGDVRLLSAHYGAGEHICGPATCKLVTVACDGTQWTDTAAGVSGTKIDQSALLDDFFAPPDGPYLPGGKYVTADGLPREDLLKLLGFPDLKPGGKYVTAAGDARPDLTALLKKG